MTHSYPGLSSATPTARLLRAVRTRRGVLIAVVLVRLTTPLWLVVNVDLPFLFAPKPLAASAWTSAAGRERLSFRPEPGVTVRGYDLPSVAPSVFVLFFYGNGDQMYRDLPFLEWLRASTGADVRVYDYRGSGFSDGALSLPAVWHDALTEFDQTAAAARAAGRPAIVYGYSLGAAAATYVATHRRPDGVVLHSPPYDVDREIAFAPRRYAALIAIAGLHARVSEDARALIDDAGRIGGIREPLLVLHGTADTFVPFEGGRELYFTAPSRDKRFVAMPGLDHTGWIPPTAGGRAVVSFVRRIAARSALAPPATKSSVPSREDSRHGRDAARETHRHPPGHDEAL